tara:strand:- start:397 stop:609 length:213 start_codon:yes stop_codon:yes gene_type:complete
MTTQFNKNNLSAEINKVLPEIEKKQNGRPNIDHLIKKILTERREANKKNLLSITVVVIAICIITFYINNS